MYIPSGELLAMALAAQAQRPTTNQQSPMFNWNSLAGPPPENQVVAGYPPVGMMQDSSMALTMPIPVPAPVPAQAAVPMPPPAVLVQAPQTAPVPIPADQMVQQMYAPVATSSIPQQEVIPAPAPVYSMYPETAQAQPQPMAPINLPGPSLTDLAAYEMFGPPVVPGPGYGPVAPQPLPQQTAWQQEPVGYNPMMADATASELYGMPMPQMPAAAPTQFAFDPSALTGATGATAMQARTAAPQPQALPPLPPPPSVYAPGRQQTGAVGQVMPVTGAVMPYQPMTDLGVPADDLYQMFSGITPEESLAMLTQQGGGEPLPRMAESQVIASPAQALQPPGVTPPTPIGGRPRQPGEEPAPQTAPGGLAFTQEFKPFDISYKTQSGKELQAKVVSYDPNTGTARLEGPNGRTIMLNRSTPSAAPAFQAIDAKYQEQIVERSKTGPGNYEMLPDMPGMNMRLAIKNADGKTVWTPARQTETGLDIEYYDPFFDTVATKPLTEVAAQDVYRPGQEQEAFGASAYQELYGKLIPAAVDNAVSPYINSLEQDDVSPYTPDQLAAMVQVTVESEDINGMPKYVVAPITKSQSGTRQVQDEDGNWVTEQYDEEVPDPRVPAGFTEELEKNLNAQVDRFKKLGALNESFLTAKPDNLGDIRVKLLEEGLNIAKAEQAPLDPASKEYKEKQKEIDGILAKIKDAKTDMTMRAGAGTVLTYQPQDIRVSNQDPRSWDTIIGQVSSGFANTGPGSTSRAGLYISPMEYAQNQALLFARQADRNRGRSVNRTRTWQYQRGSEIIQDHISKAIAAGASLAGDDPKQLAQYVDDLYKKKIEFQISSKEKVEQTLMQAANELAAAQNEMNKALAIGDKARLLKAEKNLRKQINKFRGDFYLPNDYLVQMSEEDYNATNEEGIPSFYSQPVGVQLTRPGREARMGQMATIQPEKIEGMQDRSGSDKTKPSTIIRPIIAGVGGKGFSGSNDGVLQASTTDPAQFNYIASQIKSNPERFAKSVMSAGLYAEGGGGFGNKDNEDAANAVFKAGNILMTEDSPSGEKVRAAYSGALWDMLQKSADFKLPFLDKASFILAMEKIYDDPTQAKPFLDKIKANEPSIAHNMKTQGQFKAILAASTPGYFKGSGRDITDAWIYQTSLLRMKNAVKAYSLAKTSANTGSPIGMNPISGERYVFFASPFDVNQKSLLATPSVDNGLGNSAPVLSKEALAKLEEKGELPPAIPYDIPAAKLQYSASSIFNNLNEDLTQAMDESKTPEVKAAVQKISARQTANHQPDMSMAAERAGRDETNTRLDADGKIIGRRWVIEGALIYNILFPTRQTSEIP